MEFFFYSVTFPVGLFLVVQYCCVKVFFIMVLRLDFVTYSFSYGMVCSPPTFYGFPNYENRLGATL